MNDKLFVVGLVLILIATIVSGCGPGRQRPTEAVEAPAEVRAARDAALAYVSERYGEEVPPPQTAWKEENITPGWPRMPVPGWSEYRFTAEDWVVTVGHAVLPPEQTIYQVKVKNRTGRFEWDGEVDAAGQVAERIAPTEVRAVLDAVMAYVSEYHSHQPAPEPGRIWMEERTTPEGWIGSTTYEFTAGDWVVTITSPVLPPERAVREVVVANETTGFRWEGKVDGAGNVTEAYASSEPVTDIRDPGQALQVALAYLGDWYGEQVPGAELTWIGDHPPAEDLIGSDTIEFTSDLAPGWVAAVTYGVVAPEAVVYQVVVNNEITGFQWEGEVDAAGQVTEKVAPSGLAKPQEASVDVSCADSMKLQSISGQLGVAVDSSFTVTLCSNPTTGFQWESARIGDPTVLEEASHKFVPPEGNGTPPPPGTPGKEVWTSRAPRAGRSSMSIEYSQP
jgi:predicted secreted protein